MKSGILRLMESTRLELILIVISHNKFSVDPMIGWIHAVLIIILKFSLVSIAILEVIFPFTMFFIVFPLSYVLVSIIVLINSIPFSLIVLNFSIKYTTIWVFQSALF